MFNKKFKGFIWKTQLQLQVALSPCLFKTLLWPVLSRDGQSDFIRFFQAMPDRFPLTNLCNFLQRSLKPPNAQILGNCLACSSPYLSSNKLSWFCPTWTKKGTERGIGYVMLESQTRKWLDFISTQSPQVPELIYRLNFFVLFLV